MANICKQSKISIPTLDDDFGDLGLSCLFHTVFFYFLLDHDFSQLK